MKRKKIYIVCPVRLGVSDKATAYVERLERDGHSVFYPPRDVNQDDKTGINICYAELHAIKTCDEVHVFYVAKSQGIHFDLGMAFALKKTVRIIEVLDEHDANYDMRHDSKSYLSAMRVYEKLTY